MTTFATAERTVAAREGIRSKRGARLLARVCASAWNTYADPKRETWSFQGEVSRRILNSTHSASLFLRAALGQEFDHTIGIGARSVVSRMQGSDTATRKMSRVMGGTADEVGAEIESHLDD